MPRSIGIVFTDIEGSTTMWRTHPGAMEVALVEHHRLVDQVCSDFGGFRPVDQGEGDARFLAFPDPGSALPAALELQRRLSTFEWPPDAVLRVRIAASVGEVVERDGNLFGDPVNRCARVRSAGHGGQLLITDDLRSLAAGTTGLPAGVQLRDLGLHALKDLPRGERIWQVCHPDIGADFPPLRSLGQVHHNLPLGEAASLRTDRQVVDLCRLLANHRLVTAVGFAGPGRTSLAAAAGRAAADGTIPGTSGSRAVFCDARAARSLADLGRLLSLSTSTTLAAAPAATGAGSGDVARSGLGVGRRPDPGGAR